MFPDRAILERILPKMKQLEEDKLKEIDPHDGSNFAKTYLGIFKETTVDIVLEWGTRYSVSRQIVRVPFSEINCRASSLTSANPLNEKVE